MNIRENILRILAFTPLQTFLHPLSFSGELSLPIVPFIQFLKTPTPQYPTPVTCVSGPFSRGAGAPSPPRLSLGCPPATLPTYSFLWLLWRVGGWLAFLLALAHSSPSLSSPAAPSSSPAPPPVRLTVAHLPLPPARRALPSPPGGRCQGSPLSSPLRPPPRAWRRPELTLAQRPVILGIVCNKCRAASL